MVGFPLSVREQIKRLILMYRNIINLIMFQLGWFACVLAAANALSWIGIITVVALASLHVYFVAHRRNEIILLLCAGLLGFIWESSLAAISIISYPENHRGLLAPGWMVALWVNFAITLNFSLAWFKRHLVIASLAGFVFAPLAYYAGFRLGAMTFNHTWIALSVIGIGWSILFPFLAWLAQCMTEKDNAIHHSLAGSSRHV